MCVCVCTCMCACVMFFKCVQRRRMENSLWCFQQHVLMFCCFVILRHRCIKCLSRPFVCKLPIYLYCTYASLNNHPKVPSIRWAYIFGLKIYITFVLTKWFSYWHLYSSWLNVCMHNSEFCFLFLSLPLLPPWGHI